MSSESEPDQPANLKAKTEDRAVGSDSDAGSRAEESSSSSVPSVASLTRRKRLPFVLPLPDSLKTLSPPELVYGGEVYHPTKGGTGTPMPDKKMSPKKRSTKPSDCPTPRRRGPVDGKYRVPDSYFPYFPPPSKFSPDSEHPSSPALTLDTISTPLAAPFSSPRRRGSSVDLRTDFLQAGRALESPAVATDGHDHPNDAENAPASVNSTGGQYLRRGRQTTPRLETHEELSSASSPEPASSSNDDAGPFTRSDSHSSIFSLLSDVEAEDGWTVGPQSTAVSSPEVSPFVGRDAKFGTGSSPFSPARPRRMKYGDDEAVDDDVSETSQSPKMVGPRQRRPTFIRTGGAVFEMIEPEGRVRRSTTTALPSPNHAEPLESPEVRVRAKSSPACGEDGRLLASPIPGSPRPEPLRPRTSLQPVASIADFRRRILLDPSHRPPSTSSMPLPPPASASPRLPTSNTIFASSASSAHAFASSPSSSSEESKRGETQWDRYQTELNAPSDRTPHQRRRHERTQTDPAPPTTPLQEDDMSVWIDGSNGVAVLKAAERAKRARAQTIQWTGKRHVQADEEGKVDERIVSPKPEPEFAIMDDGVVAVLDADSASALPERIPAPSSPTSIAAYRLSPPKPFRPRLGSHAASTAETVVTRYAKVYGVPTYLLSTLAALERIKGAFVRIGDVRDIYIQSLPAYGFAMVSFSDSTSVGRLQKDDKIEAVLGSQVVVEPSKRAEVQKIIGRYSSSFLSPTEGVAVLTFNDPRGLITHTTLSAFLSRYGLLRSLRNLGSDSWEAEWYDERDCEAAVAWLVSREFTDFSVAVTTGVADEEPWQRPQWESPVYNHGSFSIPHQNAPWPTDTFFGPAPPTVDVVPFVAPLPPPPPAVPRQLGGVRVSNGAYGPRAFPFPGVPASCVIDLDRIENGLDARTSVCIKNCPLRLTRDMLESFIWEVAPRSFDFLYLRVDFESHANVGYGFVSFRDVDGLLAFARARLGAKWGCFQSSKTVQMSYASCQGKEALVARFRNSAVMEAPEAFRPRTYWSSGPYVGLPEPFPSPNDPSRKARSRAAAAAATSNAQNGVHIPPLPGVQLAI